MKTHGTFFSTRILYIKAFRFHFGSISVPFRSISVPFRFLLVPFRFHFGSFWFHLVPFGAPEGLGVPGLARASPGRGWVGQPVPYGAPAGPIGPYGAVYGAPWARRCRAGPRGGRASDFE